jgi:hypothetical protein
MNKGKMKQKEKNSIYLLTLLFTFICLLSCEKDYEDIKQKNQDAIKVKEYTFDEINQISKFNNSYSEVTNGISNRLSS